MKLNRRKEAGVERPSARIRSYLEEWGRGGKLQPGDRLPTAEELAAMLGVSSGTVKNVYRELASGGLLRLQKGVGTFWSGAAASSPKSLRIGICTPSALEATATRTGWQGPILGGILKRHLVSPVPLRLQTVPIQALGGGVERSVLSELDGVIVLYLGMTIGELADERGRRIPFVTLNPPSLTETRNFVSPDYFRCSKALGEVWRKTGRRRIAYLGSGNFEGSVSTNLRFGGLSCGLAPLLGRGGELRILETSGSGQSREAASIVDSTLESGWQPDAIYCGGDILAQEAVTRLRERGFSVPEEVSVVGGSQSKGENLELLTNMLHPLERVGERLLAILLQVIQSGAPEPGVFEPVPFGIGTSTRPAENELLTEYSKAIIS